MKFFTDKTEKDTMDDPHQTARSSGVKKITFITSHNWDTKRQGGFHKFAEGCALNNYETVFFSFPRPYYGLFMKREQLNASVIGTLKKGKMYYLEKNGSDLDADRAASGKKISENKVSSTPKILNVTFPTFRLPDAAGKYLPDCVMNFLLRHSFTSFKRFAEKFLLGTDCFVFESCEGIALLDFVTSFFPDAKIVYRPSDPMVYASVPERIKLFERTILYRADKSLIVNKEAIAAYKKSIPDFDEKVKYEILSNGIDLESYTRSYPSPAALLKRRTVLYVGAWDVEWDLIFKCAERFKDLNFIVVNPNYPDKSVLKKIKSYDNVKYVPGIKPSEVPAWITNCSVVMVPYITDFYKDRPLGITAKYYQAMAAKKPIVAYCDTPELKKAGVAVTYSYDDFIKEVERAIGKKEVAYDFKLTEKDWSFIIDKFIKEILL